MKANRGYGNISGRILLRLGGTLVLELRRLRAAGKQVTLPEDFGRALA